MGSLKFAVAIGSCLLPALAFAENVRVMGTSIDLPFDYTLVGAHALHVLGALVALLVVTARARRGRYRPEAPGALEPCRMYWLFVVAVWPVLYVLVYWS